MGRVFPLPEKEIMKKEYKIIKQHSKNCDCYGSDLNDEHYVFNYSYYGNSFGNVRKIGNFHKWLAFICNDPRCKFLIIIESNYISDQIKKLVTEQ